MSKTLQGYVIIPKDTAANWAAANIVIPNGVECLETDTGYKKIGNGVSHWNNLEYSHKKKGHQIKVNGVDLPQRNIVNFTGPGLLSRDIPESDTTIVEVLMDSHVLSTPVITNDPATLTVTTNAPVTFNLSGIDSNAQSIEWYVTGSPTVITGALTGTMNSSITLAWGTAGSYTISVRAMGNGVSFANSTWSGTLTVTVQASPGNDEFTVLLLHCDGANGSSSITDSSMAGKGGVRHTVVNSGVSLSTASPLLGTASANFNGASSLSIASHVDFVFNRDKCVEFRIKAYNTDGSVFVQWVSGGGSLRNISIIVNAEGKIELYHNRSGYNYILTSVTNVINKNVHVAFTFEYATRMGRLYIDGIKEAEMSMPGDGTTSADALYIGAYNSSEGIYFVGLIDEVRVSNNLRYTANFTPPTTNFS